MIVIRLNSGEARNRLNAIAEVVEHPAAMLTVSADALVNVLQNHFSERDKQGNKLGGRRSHFWATMRNETAALPASDQSVDVQIADDRFAQKLYGGKLRAKTPWKHSGFLLLTIPVHPAAHNTRAKELKAGGLKLTFVGSAAGGILAHFPPHRGILSAAEAEGITYYVCVPEVTQQADPRALPEGDVMEEAAIRGAEDYLRAEVIESQTGKSTP